MKTYRFLFFYFFLAFGLSAQSDMVVQPVDTTEAIQYPYKRELMDLGSMGDSRLTANNIMLIRFERIEEGLDKDIRKRISLSIDGFVSSLDQQQVDFLISELKRYSSLVGDKPSHYVEHRNTIPGKLEFGIYLNKGRWLFFFDTDEFLDRGYINFGYDKAGKLVQLLRQGREMLN